MKNQETLIETLRATHGDVELYLLSPDEHGVVARGPGREAWRRFIAGAKGGKELTAMENLLWDCAVHPSREELEALLERRPALVVTYGNQLAQIAGLDGEASAKKL